MDNTIIQQGSFTSDGTTKLLNIRSDVDWMKVYNLTVADDDTQTTAIGVEYYWQRGMAAGRGIEYKKSNAANAAQLTTFLASGGFTLLPAPPTAPITGTTITKADPPVCTAANHGLENGDFVLFTNLTNMPQIALVGFSIGNVTTNTFELTYFNTNTANFTAETAFTVIKGAPFSWRGAFNNITAVTTGTTTQIQMAGIDEEVNYPVGSVLKFTVPAAYGMVELDGLRGEVLAHNTTTNTYTVDIDSTGFTAFAWPASTAYPVSLPNVTYVGTEATTSTGSVTNLDNIGMALGAGVDSPAGSNGDSIYWVAGKSFSNTVE